MTEEPLDSILESTATIQKPLIETKGAINPLALDLTHILMNDSKLHIIAQDHSLTS